MQVGAAYREHRFLQQDVVVGLQPVRGHVHDRQIDAAAREIRFVVEHDGMQRRVGMKRREFREAAGEPHRRKRRVGGHGEPLRGAANLGTGVGEPRQRIADSRQQARRPA